MQKASAQPAPPATAAESHAFSGERDLCDPAGDCTRCPRLAAFRATAREVLPDGHNAPVPSRGSTRARFLVVGLAPGLHGANRTGQPFSGDASGELLHAMLIEHGFASRSARARTPLETAPHHVARLIDCRITNAVRCVPPANKPTPAEIEQCRPFLAATIAGMPRLRVILALGRIAHDSTLRALDHPLRRRPFAHAAMHKLDGGITLVDSFHCSRYNINTGRLTREMFAAVFKSIRAEVA